MTRTSHCTNYISEEQLAKFTRQRKLLEARKDRAAFRKKIGLDLPTQIAPVDVAAIGRIMRR
jgi:hypothetical protein